MKKKAGSSIGSKKFKEQRPTKKNQFSKNNDLIPSISPDKPFIFGLTLPRGEEKEYVGVNANGWLIKTRYRREAVVFYAHYSKENNALAIYTKIKPTKFLYWASLSMAIGLFEKKLGNNLYCWKYTDNKLKNTKVDNGKNIGRVRDYFFIEHKNPAWSEIKLFPIF